MDIVDKIFENLARKGDARYGGEAVTQLQHALQCAELARQAGAGDALVAAALLHDYGHLINDDDAEAAAAGRDQFHEEIAAEYLAHHFPPAVTEPIRMHVPAKRYLCAVDKAYYDDLSPASKQSLAVQGGVFNKADAAAFIVQPYAEDAVMLRHWDDLAKDPKMETAPLGAFRDAVDRARK